MEQDRRASGIWPSGGSGPTPASSPGILKSLSEMKRRGHMTPSNSERYAGQQLANQARRAILLLLLAVARGG
jgi:hypothetical protein